MAATKPAALCTLRMSSGKLCRAVALRGRPFCYHHSRNHRDHSRDRILGRRLDRLGDQLDAMSAAELLDFLHQQLCTLPKTLSRFPEVSYTLTHTLDRLSEITSLESNLNAFLQHSQQFTAHLDATLSNFNDIPVSSPESNTYAPAPTLNTQLNQ